MIKVHHIIMQEGETSSECMKKGHCQWASYVLAQWYVARTKIRYAYNVHSNACDKRNDNCTCSTTGGGGIWHNPIYSHAQMDILGQSG